MVPLLGIGSRSTKPQIIAAVVDKLSEHPGLIPSLLHLPLDNAAAEDGTGNEDTEDLEVDADMNVVEVDADMNGVEVDADMSSAEVDADMSGVEG